MNLDTGYIVANAGNIIYGGYKSCVIWHDGGLWNGSDNGFEGKHYGLIDYKCDNVAGSLFSKLSCEPCGLYCARNELVDGCQAFGIPMMVGMIIGFLLSVLIMMAWSKWARDPIFDSISNKFDGIREGKREAKVAKMRKIRTRLNELEAIDRLDSQMMVIAILFMLFSLANACDNTLYMTSTGSICDNYGCKRSNMYDLSLMSGSTLCFRDKVGETMSIRMSRSSYIYRSEKVYYTSSYEMKIDQHWECKGAGICWSGGCHKLSKHKALDRPTKPNSIVGYGCSTGTLGCDTMCWHQTSCTYYRWEILPKGQMASVYKIMSRIWEVEVMITYQNKTKRNVMNVNNPRVNLDGIGNGQVPLLLTGFSSQHDMIEAYYIHVNGNNYNIDASPINMPSRDNVGDIQFDIYNGSVSFNSDDVQCDAESCRAMCKVHEPRFDRVRNNLDRYVKHDGFFINNGNTLRTSVEVEGMSRIMIGDVDLESLKVSKPKCLLNVIGSLACVGCTMKSYIVLQASEIKEPGLLKFTSNCTFSTDSVSCNQEPYRLEIISQDERCRLYFPSLNQTLDVSLDFRFLGKLDPSSPLYSMGTSVDDYISLAQNPNMWTTAAYTWLTFSLVGLIVSIISRNMQSIITFWGAKKVIDKAESV
nr:MAG: glycoprotein [Orthophasmavirus culicis]